MLNKQFENIGGVEVYNDTEVLTYESNFKAYGNASNRFYKSGNVVQMACQFSNIDAITDGYTNNPIATITDASLRPRQTITALMQASFTNFYCLEVLQNGVIRMSRHRNEDGRQSLNALQWLNAYMTWIV